MNAVIELILSALIIAGGLLVLLGSYGLVKLPDFYARLHAPTKATTLGMGCLLLASLVMSSLNKGSVSVHELLITLFLFITAPIAAHMLAKTALHLEIGVSSTTRNPELRHKARERLAPESE